VNTVFLRVVTSCILLEMFGGFLHDTADSLKRRRTSTTLHRVISEKIFTFPANNNIYFINHMSSPQGDFSSRRLQVSTTAFPKLNPS
jgi:hypothetical protein